MENTQIMTNTQAHRAVRNLVNNEFGITKEYTQKLIEDKIADVTREYLRELNTNLLESTIKKVVLEFITKGVSGGGWYDSRTPFDKYIQQVITKTIQDEVINSFNINIERK